MSRTKLSQGCAHVCVFHLIRSLTKRQRELLQAYADDVEGRLSKPNSFSSGPGEPAGHASKSSGEVHSEASSANDSDGTHTFTDASYWPKRGEGWVSSAWQRLRRFVGL